MTTTCGFTQGEPIIPRFDGTVAPEGENGGPNTHVRNEFNMVKQFRVKGDKPKVLLKCIDNQLRWFDAGLFKRPPA